MEWFIVWIGLAIATSVSASNKGRSGLGWFIIGFITGPIGLIISLVLSKDEKAIELDSLYKGTHKKCPYCAEMVKKEAVVCKHCNREIIDSREELPAADAIRSGEDTYPLQVVGESFYQTTLNSLCGGKNEDGHNKKVTARVVADFKNIHDNNAYKIEIDGHTVGYLARDKAKELKTLIGDRVLKCPAIITGGWKRNKDEGDYGIRLDIVW